MASSRILILSTMRDEGPYVLEWLAYHRAIGFTDFLIYTNDCRDGTDLLLDRLAQNGELIHVRNKVLRRGPQKSAYKAAMQHPAYAKADWVYACDIDEFLNIRIGDGRIEDLLEYFPQADAIPVCWRLFSNNGHTGMLDGFTIEAFTDAESETHKSGDVGRFVKSIFRPRAEITRIGSHTPIYDKAFGPKANWGAAWLQAGKQSTPARPKLTFGYDIAQVNHYAVRTVDTFLLKRDRGDVNHMAGRLELQYWNRWCKGGTKDTSILRHLAKMNTEYARLTSDPIVQSLHHGAIQCHAERLNQLLEDPEYRDIKISILATQPVARRETATHSANPETEALVVKAPGRHKNRLKMLAQMPKQGRCAEIGVWNGGFSAAILDITKPRELILIDPWELLADQSEGEWTHKRHEDQKFMKSMFDNVTRQYGALQNVKIRKGFSADVLEEFPDGYFDWVYIDGNHLYEFVRKDIEISFRKVRPGGIIAGDDFFWKKDGRMHVREAVLDAMRAHGMTNRPTRIGQQYMITNASG